MKHCQHGGCQWGECCCVKANAQRYGATGGQAQSASPGEGGFKGSTAVSCGSLLDSSGPWAIPMGLVGLSLANWQRHGPCPTHTPACWGNGCGVLAALSSATSSQPQKASRGLAAPSPGAHSAAHSSATALTACFRGRPTQRRGLSPGGSKCL